MNDSGYKVIAVIYVILLAFVLVLFTANNKLWDRVEELTAQQKIQHDRINELILSCGQSDSFEQDVYENFRFLNDKQDKLSTTLKSIQKKLKANSNGKSKASATYYILA